MRYFFHIGYNGYRYHGWQKQVGHSTIQEVMEKNLCHMLKTPVTLFGCGRTDAQVHATQYFFHADIKKEWDFDLAFRLNKTLPEDIAVFDIIRVDNNSHAQYDAIKRTYDYFIHTHKNPFLHRFSCLYLEKKIHTDKMQQALALLTVYKDYRAFCKSPDKYLHTICNVTSARLFYSGTGDTLRIQISSDRFLRGMIRAIVARLLKIGKGEMSTNEFEDYLISKKNVPHIEFSPPQGLYLSEVVYPFLHLPSRPDFYPLFQNKKEEVFPQISQIHRD